MCCDHDMMEVEGWRQEGEERWKEMKSGAWGGKQEVELVAQALTNQRRVRPQRRPGPGEGGSVAMELRCGRAQATKQEPKKGPWVSGKLPVQQGRTRQGRAGQPDTGDLGTARQPRPQLCIPKQIEEREVQVQVQVQAQEEELGEWGRWKGEGEFGRSRRRAS